MSLPGVVPTSQLLSLLAESDTPNVGGVLGLNVGDAAAYRASLSGQRAPIFGKGGYQGFGSLEPYGQVYQLANVETATDSTPTDGGGGDFVKNPAVIDKGDKNIPTGKISPTAATDGDKKDPVGGFAVSNYLPDLGKVNVPYVGEVDVTDTITNTAADALIGGAIDPLFGGLGVVSAFINPTFKETSWGTPFNTGGGGLIGVLGQLSLNDLENTYAEAQKGTEGYEFYAPGTIAGVNQPIGVKPGLFGEVLTGPTNTLDQDVYDPNNDGIVTVQEFKVGSGMQDEPDYSDYLFTDLGNSIQEAGSEFVDNFTSGFTQTFSDIGSGIESVGTGISNVVSDVGEGVSSFFESVGDIFTGGDDSSSNNDSGGGSTGGGFTGGGDNEPSSSDSLCFLTTAIVERRGEPDDGPTLTKLRNFRDTYMADMPELVKEYYLIAPEIVAAIPKDHDDWRWIGEQIDISVSCIDKGDLESAFKTYKAMVEWLKHEWL